MREFLKEFKAFAVKGNVADLAVAVIIGGAFGKIVSSLVDNVIMPVIGIFLGGVNFTGLSFGFGTIVLKYGAFLQSIVDFVVIALVIFIAIRFLSRAKRTTEEVVEEVKKEASDEIKLLSEIRDLLVRKMKD